MLGHIVSLMRNVVVAGSHGKTTTTSLISNIFAQAGKCNVHSIVLACDTEPVIITPAPGKMVTVYPREIDLKNYKLLKKFKNTDVVKNINELKKVIKKWR